MVHRLPRQKADARVVIENVRPEIDCGRFPAKSIAGNEFIVTADIFAEGHDVLAASLFYRPAESRKWQEARMVFLGNDAWRGSFVTEGPGEYHYTLTGWVDRFGTWRGDFRKRVEAAQEDIGVYLQEAAEMVEAAASNAAEEDAPRLHELAALLGNESVDIVERGRAALGDELLDLMERNPDCSDAVTYPRKLIVHTDRVKAGFSSWYEMFPRSAGPPGNHGTFKDVEHWLPYIAGMGFDVLYLPPVHPIGHTARKGRNNSVTAGPDDPGTPWAIGSEEGGHKAIDPRLGTLKDFQHLVRKAKDYNIEIALDIALQCSPDHPYVKEHPEWFEWRPDGTIQYAENPPKKYQDIYPLYFETHKRQELWDEMKSIFTFWAEQGVRIFRVDNPHTKPFAFWEWLIAEVKKEYPESIFLAEAFTRPKIMYRLAKLGFTQSYTYFTWRNNKAELTDYLRELTETPVKDFFRPNFWPNTPDILHAYLQHGGRPAFIARLVLAATLSSNYGIYGPAYELMQRTPLREGSEEYLDSEKYEIKLWNIDSGHSLKDLISRVNRIRRENPALQNNRNLWFNAADNDNIICYSKHTEDRSNIILVVVNLDPHHTQSAWFNVPLAAWGLSPDRPCRAEELLGGTEITWHGEWNYIELDPARIPALIFRIRQDRVE